MILMDDYDFLLSPLTQPALKRPLFLPQMVLDLDFFYVSLKTRSSAKAPPPSGAFAPGSPLLRTQMNEHLLDVPQCLVCSVTVTLFCLFITSDALSHGTHVFPLMGAYGELLTMICGKIHEQQTIRANVTLSLPRGKRQTSDTHFEFL